MPADYTWTVILVAVVCWPVVPAVLLSVSRTRPWRPCLFAAVASVAGLWPLWFYSLWHGRHYGWRPANWFDFSQTVLVLSIAAPLLHGAVGFWLFSHLEAGASGERKKRPYAARLWWWLVVRRTLCRGALGLWLGWLASDGAGMLFSGAVAHEVTRRCCSPFESSCWNPLPAGRFLLLLLFTLVVVSGRGSLCSFLGVRSAAKRPSPREVNP